MGSDVIDLLEPETTNIKRLRGSTFTVDAHNILYQFLTTIRQHDGGYLTDKEGNVTSHLVGLFNRMTRLMMHNMRFIYCFDGDIPELKQDELDRRKERKEEAKGKYEEAKEEGDTEAMKKYSRQTTKLTSDMIEEAKKLIDALGQAWVQAPSEGEAQASHIVRVNDADAVVSQDADCFLFGTPTMVKNLAITGKRKLPDKQAYTEVKIEQYHLDENLNRLGIDHEQLIAIAVLTGTDFNEGIHGVGPKTALKLVQEHGNDYETIFDEAGWDENLHWRDVMDVFHDMPTTDSYDISFDDPDDQRIKELLVEEHDFSQENVQETLDELEAELSYRQKGLGEF